MSSAVPGNPSGTSRSVPRPRAWRAAFALLLLAGCSRSCGNDNCAGVVHGPFPSLTVPHTEVRPLARSANGRRYQLTIGLPDSYQDDPERHYPVLYLCDGYWDFDLVRSIAANLEADKAIPDIIVVGLGYPGDDPNYGRMRRWDLTPVPAHYDGAVFDGPSGHAQEFLAVIEHQIIPLMERDYRADPAYRVLAGSSLGGLFTLYAMFARPGLFTAYVAASPVAEWDDDWLLGFENRFHDSGQPLGARLFVTGAEKEFPEILAGAKRFDARIRQRAYPGLAYRFRVIDGERHAGTKAESYTRGLRFAFAPRAPLPSE